jgi:hypothetical protein
MRQHFATCLPLGLKLFTDGGNGIAVVVFLLILPALDVGGAGVLFGGGSATGIRHIAFIADRRLALLFTAAQANQK